MSAKPIIVDNWLQPPFNRHSFQRVQALFPTVRIRRGAGPVSDVGSGSAELGEIPFTQLDGSASTLGRLLESSCTDAFLVAKDDELVCEQYSNGMAPDSHHLLNSVPTSFVGMLTGIVAARGQLDPGDPVSKHLPEFAGSAFDETSIRHALDMSAAVAYGEDYADPNSDFWIESAVVGWQPGLVTSDLAKTLFDYARGLKQKEQPDGDKFHYRSVLTNVLGMVLERATGSGLGELLEAEIWKKLGTEHDASIVADRVGFPYVGAGMSCSARDLLRFGLMLVNEGRLNGEQIVPQEWVQDTCVADAQAVGAFARGEYGEAIPGAHYRNQCWVTDAERGVMLGVGIFGQSVHVNLTAKTVIVKLSSQPEPLDFELFLNSFAAMNAVSETL